MLQAAFILLWVRSRFWIAELMLVLNFFNLMSLYFYHSTPVLLIQIPVISGPLAWTFVALFWDGAAMVGAHSLPARILANVAIWMILVFGTFFLAFFKDWAMGFALTVLSACKFLHSFQFNYVGSAACVERGQVRTGIRLKMYSTCCRPTDYQNHRPAMDLRFRDHGVTRTFQRCNLRPLRARQGAQFRSR